MILRRITFLTVLIIVVSAGIWKLCMLRSSGFYDNQMIINPVHKLLLQAVSSDGLEWSVNRNPITNCGCTSTHLDSKKIRTVFYYKSGSRLGQLMQLSLEGKKTVVPVLCDICGRDAKNACIDPNLVILPDGRIRLYFILAKGGMDPAFSDHNQVRSAISSDGFHWECESGIRFEGKVVDPDIVDLPQGGYRMYFSQVLKPKPDVLNPVAIVICSAVSSDGILFDLEPGDRIQRGCASSTILLPDGRFRMYFHSNDNFLVGPRTDPTSYILSAVSSDGLNFQMEAGIRLGRYPVPGSRYLGSQAPSVFRKDDGTFSMTFTTIEEPIFPLNFLVTKEIERNEPTRYYKRKGREKTKESL